MWVVRLELASVVDVITSSQVWPPLGIRRCGEKAVGREPEISLTGRAIAGGGAGRRRGKGKAQAKTNTVGRIGRRSLSHASRVDQSAPIKINVFKGGRLAALPMLVCEHFGLIVVGGITIPAFPRCVTTARP